MSFVPQFRLFIGVDQTGAALSGGIRARPLPCAYVVRTKSRWKLEVFNEDHAPLTLSSFNRAEIEARSSSCNVPIGEVALAVDCVMGLHESTWPACRGGSPALWHLFAEAARVPAYGLKPAAAFFDSIRDRANITSRPARRCEILSKANSVFNTHPFQKNVQCGTFRIWRDLGLENLAPHERWLRFWCFDPIVEDDSQAWFFESYPSLFWREILGARTRDITSLRERITTTFNDEVKIDDEVWSLLEHDADHADSAVLALGAWALQKKRALFKGPKREPWLAREGWIAGLKP